MASIVRSRFNLPSLRLNGFSSEIFLTDVRRYILLAAMGMTSYLLVLGNKETSLEASPPFFLPQNLWVDFIAKARYARQNAVF